MLLIYKTMSIGEWEGFLNNFEYNVVLKQLWFFNRFPYVGTHRKELLKMKKNMIQRLSQFS